MDLSAVKEILLKSHNTYTSYDIAQKAQFFTDKSIDTLILVNGSPEFLDKALKAFGNVSVKVYGKEEKQISLADFDGDDCIIYIKGAKVEERKRYDFYDLIDIMTRLRAKDGCEWDKAQTHESIRINLIEEAYELVEAIDAKDKDMMLEEIGDVLLQAVFHAHIAMDEKMFDYLDVLYELCHKLITRHTHIFGSNHASNADEALNFWNAAKKEEKHYSDFTDSMERVPKNLPALLYAEKIQKRAKKCGFDFPDLESAESKVREELAELKEAKADEKAKEGGDLLFAVVNLLRLMKIEPETALSDSSKKFMARFKKMEEILTADGKTLDEFTLAEMDAVWDRVKQGEKAE